VQQPAASGSTAHNPHNPQAHSGYKEGASRRRTRCCLVRALCSFFSFFLSFFFFLFPLSLLWVQRRARARARGGGESGLSACYDAVGRRLDWVLSWVRVQVAISRAACSLVGGGLSFCRLWRAPCWLGRAGGFNPAAADEEEEDESLSKRTIDTDRHSVGRLCTVQETSSAQQ
jgi:hypothetical protein